MVSWLLSVVLIGALLGSAAFFLAAAVRTVEFIQSMQYAGIKPWSCNLCMSFWSTTFVTGGAALAVSATGVPMNYGMMLAAAVPAMTVSTLLLERYGDVPADDLPV